MSWRFPKFPTKANRIPDVDDMNANFLAVAEELGGQLNEHNWKVNAITDKADVSQDIFVWHSSFQDVQDQKAHISISPRSIQIPERTSWRIIEGSTGGDASVTFSSPACLLWIHASLQIVQDPDSPTGNTWANDNYFNYALAAIEVDGYVIPETVIGGAEPDNDRVHGVFYGAMPVATSVVFPVGPGMHKVSIVAKTGARAEGRGIHVDNAELICLEMRR